MSTLWLDGEEYSVVTDDLLPKGKRAIERREVATNASSPSRIRRAEWKLGGPIGASLESLSGGLRVDYTQNLETRYEDRLLSLGKRNPVALSATNPPGAAAATAFGTSYFGTAYFGGAAAATGTSDGSGDIVRVFDEQQAYLFAGHGAIETQIDIATWTALSSYTFAAPVLGAINWYQNGYIALGPTVGVAVRSIGATVSYGLNLAANGGATLIYSRAWGLGSDRIWYINEQNKLGYSLDGFVSIASPFGVGDPQQNGNGIGPFGPFTYIGKDNGLFSFTDQGKPVPLSKALVGHHSPHNGLQWADPGWGWNYTLTDIGLRAISGSTDNPVGIGERMIQFTGHGGRPTAVFADRGEMWVAYQTDDGAAYLYRCRFGPQTAGTGQPEMYPARYLTATEIGAIFATNTPTNPAIVWGENGDIAYETISRDGRDDLFADREYSVSGGTWYGTTLDRDPHMLKTLRRARVRVLNVRPCNTWQLAFAYDVEPWHTPTYYDCGPELDQPGYWTLTPSMGTAPLPIISGRNIKARLVQTAEEDGDPLPPEVNGTLEIEYDERPAFVEETNVLLTGGMTDVAYRRLSDLASEKTAGPVKARIEGVECWVMVADVPKRVDLKGNGVESVAVQLHVWEAA